MSRKWPLVRSHDREIIEMDRLLAKQFRDRWKAVEAVEIQEQRAASVHWRWKQLNALWNLAAGLGQIPQPDDSKSVVYERWARLKGGKH